MLFSKLADFRSRVKNASGSFVVDESYCFCSGFELFLDHFQVDGSTPFEFQGYDIPVEGRKVFETLSEFSVFDGHNFVPAFNHGAHSRFHPCGTRTADDKDVVLCLVNVGKDFPAVVIDSRKFRTSVVDHRF